MIINKINLFILLQIPLYIRISMVAGLNPILEVEEPWEWVYNLEQMDLA